MAHKYEKQLTDAWEQFLSLGGLTHAIKTFRDKGKGIDLTDSELEEVFHAGFGTGLMFRESMENYRAAVPENHVKL